MRLANIIAFIQLHAIVAMVWAVVWHRWSRRPLGTLWIAGFSVFMDVYILSTLLVAEDSYFALNPDTLAAEVALQYLRDREFVTEVVEEFLSIAFILGMVFLVLPKVKILNKPEKLD